MPNGRPAASRQEAGIRLAAGRACVFTERLGGGWNFPVSGRVVAAFVATHSSSPHAAVK
jgi:hypothetical protein